MENGPELLPEPSEVFSEVRGDEVVIWPARPELSDAEVVGEAAATLWKRAQARPDDALTAARARVLRCLASGDEKAILALELAALELHPQDVNANDHPGPSGSLATPRGALPPRAGVDRHRNLAGLVEFVAVVVRWGEPSFAHAAVVVEMVASLFPQLAARYRRGGSISPKSDAADRVLEAWTNRADRAAKKIANLDPEALTLDVLRAHGIERTEAHDWLRGAARETRKLMARLKLRLAEGL